jgi:hypothetical protein
MYYVRMKEEKYREHKLHLFAECETPNGWWYAAVEVLPPDGRQAFELNDHLSKYPAAEKALDAARTLARSALDVGVEGPTEVASMLERGRQVRAVGYDERDRLVRRLPDGSLEDLPDESARD